MLQTMRQAEGIGLAATQVDVHERVIVIDVSEKRDAPMVLVNPELLWTSAERVKGDEGCLSVPDFSAEVKRAENVVLRALDLDGREVVETASGLRAVCC